MESGDLVVIFDDMAPRNSWVLGRILKTLPGSKGLVRSVIVKTKTNVLQRPANELCLLLEAGEMKSMTKWTMIYELKDELHF